MTTDELPPTGFVRSYVAHLAVCALTAPAVLWCAVFAFTLSLDGSTGVLRQRLSAGSVLLAAAALVILVAPHVWLARMHTRGREGRHGIAGRREVLCSVAAVATCGIAGWLLLVA